MAAIWVATVFLTGLKHYRAILLIFLLGYGATMVLALFFRRYLGMEGLLLGFVIGHFLLLAGMVWLVYRNYHSNRFIAFDIWEKGAMYHSLMATGFMFNLGVWIDKLIFWYYPGTGQHVIGPLNASVIYDFPIFLSYLTVIPGMACFWCALKPILSSTTPSSTMRCAKAPRWSTSSACATTWCITCSVVCLTLPKSRPSPYWSFLCWVKPCCEWLGISTLYLAAAVHRRGGCRSASGDAGEF
jgi:hypothetical protein